MNNSDFLYNEFGRLRSGWRFIIFTVIFSVISTLIGFITFLTTIKLTQDQQASFLFTPLGMFITSITSLFTATFLGWMCGKYLEELPFKALGWVFNRTWLKDYLLGMLLGIITISIAVGITLPTGEITLAPNLESGLSAISKTFLTSFCVFFVAAAFEEALFRGYILQTLSRANLALLGLLLTSLPFALVHLGNPNANIISTVNTALAGIWLGIAYLKTRSLWLAFGLHLAWNWWQGAFFGIKVSGIGQLTPHPLFIPTRQGADWLTGGEYGIEGGIACTIALVISTILIWTLPVFYATDEMMALTSQENSKKISLR